MTAIQAQWTKERKEMDGLSTPEVTERLLKSPMEHITVVAVVEVTHIDHDVRTGVRTPKVRLVAIEPVFGEAAENCTADMKQAFQERTDHPMPIADLFNAETADERADAPDETAVDQPTLADGVMAGVPDPTAAPWPGDAGYPADRQDELDAQRDAERS